MVNYHLTFSGRVQGVGFRWGCVQIARRWAVAGYVKNLLTGEVYIEVQGKADQVTGFINQVKRGPTPYARIVHCTCQTGAYRDYGNTFTIRR